MSIFEHIESNVRSYCRAFPDLFARARGSRLITEDGREFIDFWAGAGTLNYGHNNPRLKQKLIEYIEKDGLAHALDLSTAAKRDFLDRFEQVILKPRHLDYKVQFPGPTGTNAIEAALKLARKVKKRHNVICFTNAYHGMTLGALSATGNASKRAGAGISLANVTHMPFDGYGDGTIPTLDYLEAVLDDEGSGVDKPAAVILETVQAEGGVKVASLEWLSRLQSIVHQRDILLIIDDIQTGCGRTGPFFSFEEAGLQPDIVCLSKSISGFGLPMALVLLARDLDIWKPGEHNGTFRGNNLAFVTATEALGYWENDDLSQEVARKAKVARERLEGIAGQLGEGASVRGRGLIQGLVCRAPGMAERISRRAFERGLVIETAGVRSEVVKLLPALTISDEELKQGLDLLEESARAVLDEVELEAPQSVA
jgi:diaminobutyrate-2-oxoglutarate transaminase